MFKVKKYNNNLLGNICEITTGKLDANAMEENGKYRFYTCAREYYFINRYEFDTEALLISGNGANVGYIHHYKGKFNAYQRTYVLMNIKIDIVFLKYFLESNLHKRINREKNSGNTPYITMPTIHDMPIAYPSLQEEQQKIGSFLSAIDELIEKSKKRELQLFSFQKTQLEKLFKANDNNYTLIPLNHLAKIFDGTHQTPNYVDSGVPFVSVEDIKNLKITSKYISQIDFERNFKIYPIKGDILMTRIGDIGTSSLFEENYPIAFYVSLALIKCKGIVPKYLNQFIKSEFFQRELNKRTIHAAFPKKINLSEIGNCIVLVPSQEVQLKIGEYLTNLSKLIELESKRRMLYEKAMKEYLERIFGG
jgi:type I restriction enzyme S subunit